MSFAAKFTLSAILALLLCATQLVRAADYPSRPITLVVAFTPGGASDVLARILARRLEPILGQPMIIENRPGAGGNVAAEAVAHAVPDGYTLLNGNNAILATNAALYKNIVHVPYKGAAPALQDVIAGHVQMMFATASSVVSHIKQGAVRPIAVTTRKRTAVLPEIPTIDELGITGFDATTWHGLVAPAGTPAAVISMLNRALAAALADSAVQKALADLGVDIMGGTPEEFAAYIQSEIPKWTAVIKASGASAVD